MTESPGKEKYRSLTLAEKTKQKTGCEPAGTHPVFYLPDYDPALKPAALRRSRTREYRRITDYDQSVINYASVIAPTGHVPSQAPQSMQASASMLYWESPWEIASTGQEAAQVPQLMQFSSITLAISVSSLKM
jgi:hypothetical protein